MVVLLMKESGRRYRNSCMTTIVERCKLLTESNPSLFYCKIYSKSSALDNPFSMYVDNMFACPDKDIAILFNK